MKGYTIFSGSANPALAEKVARELKVSLAPCVIERFPDGEVAVRIEESVRGREVFIIQPTSHPVNDHLLELVAFADALRRADAIRITAIIPYFGYARSDRRAGHRVAIMASAVADILQSVGVHHVVTFDMHAAQIEGFFRIPVDNLTAVPMLCDALQNHIAKETVVISPDLGAMRRTREFAERLGLSVAVLLKRRLSGTEVEVSQVAGDVRDRPCLIVDDMISTGGTIIESIRMLLQEGARPDMVVATTHGLFIDNALEKLIGAGVREIFVADTIAQPQELPEKMHRVSIAPIIAMAVRKLLAHESLRELYC